MSGEVHGFVGVKPGDGSDGNSIGTASDIVLRALAGRHGATVLYLVVAMARKPVNLTMSSTRLHILRQRFSPIISQHGTPRVADVCL